MLKLRWPGTNIPYKEEKVVEPFDEYVDQFVLAGGAYGVTLNFRKSSGKPMAPGTQLAFQEIGTIRMSFEHFKVMAFIMKRQIDEIEEQLGIEIPLSPRVMNDLKIPPEDWQQFWQRKR